MKDKINPGGFTLLELLLAMALCAILLASVSTSILRHYQTKESGQREIDAARTLLALSRDLRQDLSSVAGSTASEPTTSSLNDVTISERALTYKYVFQYETVSLFGTRDFLALGTLVPTIQHEKATKTATPVVHQCILWSSRPQSELKIPYLKISQEVGFLAMPQTDRIWAVPTLTRSTLHLGNPCTVLQTRTYPSGVLAASFRYLDLDQWRDSWDSVAQGRIPQAIEIKLQTPDSPRSHRLLCNLERVKIK